MAYDTYVHTVLHRIRFHHRILIGDIMEALILVLLAIIAYFLLRRDPATKPKVDAAVTNAAVHADKGKKRLSNAWSALMEDPD